MLSLEEATRIADALRDRDARGAPLALAVVDAGDCVRLLVVEDGCARLRGPLAQAKASTALALGFATSTLAGFAATQPQAMEALWRQQPQLLPVGGGLAFGNAGGELRGAIGVSGATPDEDDALARTALERAGFRVLAR